MIQFTMNNVRNFWAAFLNDKEQSIEIECSHGSRWKLLVCKFIYEEQARRLKLYLPWEDSDAIEVPFLITVNGNKKLFKIVRI